MVVVDVSKDQVHSVVLNRTGRVINVLDAAQPSKALAIQAVAKALGQVNNVQCGAAGGECGGTAAVKDGPPPMGGDEPGFLATGDLPPAGDKIAPWVATPVESPRDEFKGSQCENVNWATKSAESKASRVYLVQESGANFFGLNEIVLTTKNTKAAGKLVDEIKSNLTRCKKLSAHRKRDQARQSHQHRRSEHQDHWLDGGGVAEVDPGHSQVSCRDRMPRDRK